MPEDAKKNQSKKSKNEPKEQRKSRSRHHVQRAIDKKPEESQVPILEKNVQDEPGPEFYQNLKRETDEILKITKEETSKYKKKEILSNWTKYEMPLASYDDVEENENMGADYEKLIDTPPSIGGYFQFKHEKSWDAVTTSSLYDKYFQIDMNNLGIALCTIPFYERNDLELSIFSETDILNMNNRSIRYKQKYYNDKSYTTSEDEVIEKSINNLKESFREAMCDTNIQAISVLEDEMKKSDPIADETDREKLNKHADVTYKVDDKVNNIQQNDINKTDQSIDIKPTEDTTFDMNKPIMSELNTENRIQKMENQKTENMKSILLNPDISEDDELDTILAMATSNISVKEMKPELPMRGSSTNEVKDLKNPLKKQQTTSVLESPEDLDKWLDEFLDS